ncbi:MAG: cytochrome C oxidase subunit I [Bacteroidota bacterium]|nr:cytochrome C oxidase subunit I [Bacteroidota bacterium]
MFAVNNADLVKNTTYKAVVPFYVYASISFLVAAWLLFLSSGIFNQHYFQPKILAITHTMALGWGTMMILGASHQLVPVLIEGKLFSIPLAYLTFALVALGIPLLVYGFYSFDMGWPAQWGAILINAGILTYVINLALSINQSKKENIHAVFVFTASLWLLLTTIIGLLLVYNFSTSLLPNDSLHYLSLHAHLGIIGWFLLLVTGVGSRLIPMFLISKYNNTKLLWTIFALINAGLLLFICIFLYFPNPVFYFIPLVSVFIALILFGYYCYSSFKQRLRKHVDEQMKISLLSIMMMLIPVMVLISTIVWIIIYSANSQLIMLYGFTIFFGWITAIILGMTFKTLPFIIWNKVYHHQAGLGKTPNPKDLFNNRLFNLTGILFLLGFVLFIIGIFSTAEFILKIAALLLLLAAILYNWNVLKLVLHKPVKP